MFAEKKKRRVTSNLPLQIVTHLSMNCISVQFVQNCDISNYFWLNSIQLHYYFGTFGLNFKFLEGYGRICYTVFHNIIFRVYFVL